MGTESIDVSVPIAVRRVVDVRHLQLTTHYDDTFPDLPVHAVIREPGKRPSQRFWLDEQAIRELHAYFGTVVDALDARADTSEPVNERAEDQVREIFRSGVLTGRAAGLSPAAMDRLFREAADRE